MVLLTLHINFEFKSTMYAMSCFIVDMLRRRGLCRVY
ncbi:unnamed protein product [Brassica oleracea var. botrytis]